MKIMKILKKATPPNENRSPLESLDELDEANLTDLSHSQTPPDVSIDSNNL